MLPVTRAALWNITQWCYYYDYESKIFEYRYSLRVSYFCFYFVISMWRAKRELFSKIIFISGFNRRDVTRLLKIIWIGININISKHRYIKISIYQNIDISSKLIYQSDIHQISTVDIFKKNIKYQISIISNTPNINSILHY